MVLLAAIVLVGLLALVIPAFVSQAADLASNVEAGTRKVATLLEPLGVTAAEVDRAIDQGVADLESSRGRIAGGVLTGALMLTQWAAAALLTLVLTFFFVKDGARLWDWIVCFFHDEKRPYVAEVGRAGLERAQRLRARRRGGRARATRRSSASCWSSSACRWPSR